MTSSAGAHPRTAKAQDLARRVGVIAALVGGILQRLDGNSLPQAIEYACGAFAATVLFAFTLFHFLGGQRSREQRHLSLDRDQTGRGTWPAIPRRTVPERGSAVTCLGLLRRRGRCRGLRVRPR